MGESPSFTATQDEYGRVAHTPLLQHRIMWASRPHSFTATQGKGGRATRPPLPQHSSNVGESPTLRSRFIILAECNGSNKPAHYVSVASRLKRPVVSIETFPVIYDDPF
jgi:hypothetical protein